MNWLKYFNPFYGLGTSNVGTDEDSSRAPLIAHLTELRGRLLAFFAVFMVLIVAGFVIAKPLYQIVARPWLTRWRRMASRLICTLCLCLNRFSRI